MRNNHFHQYEDIPDPLDDFLAQLLGDIPEFLPIPVTTPSPQLQPLPPPLTSAPHLDPVAYHVSNPPPTCQWVLTQDHPLICGAPLSPNPKHVCTHFRQAHDVRGNEKVIVTCHWRDCQAPMQRGSLIRHLLSVHLGLLRWRCEVCEKVFSRKGTWHACADARKTV